MRTVWAAGDLVGEPMLEHKAEAQGQMVAETIAGYGRRFDPACIPSVCFVESEIVSAGLLPNEAGARGDDVVTAISPFSANGRALAIVGGDGFVRVLASRSDHRVVGIQAVGSHVAERSGEFSHALEMGAVLEDIVCTVHVHPTLSEAFHSAVSNAPAKAPSADSARPRPTC